MIITINGFILTSFLRQIDFNTCNHSTILHNTSYDAIKASKPKNDNVIHTYLNNDIFRKIGKTHNIAHPSNNDIDNDSNTLFNSRNHEMVILK